MYNLSIYTRLMPANIRKRLIFQMDIFLFGVCPLFIGFDGTMGHGDYSRSHFGKSPICFSWPLYYHLCVYLFALSLRFLAIPNRTDTYFPTPPKKQTKQNTIEKGKAVVLLYSEPIKNTKKQKTKKKQNKKNTLLVWDGRSRPREDGNDPAAGGALLGERVQNTITAQANWIHIIRQPQLVTHSDASFPTVRKRGGAAIRKRKK